MKLRLVVIFCCCLLLLSTMKVFMEVGFISANMKITAMEFLESRNSQPAASDYDTDTQKHRKETVQRACQSNVARYTNTQSNFDIRQFLFYDNKHNLVYCGIQKVGFSFLWDLLMALGRTSVSGKNLPSVVYSMFDTGGFSFNNVNDIMLKSYKFMFVRDPYERLYSGYIDKLFSANVGYWGFGKDTIRPILNKVYNESKTSTCGQDISFLDFVRFLPISETVYTDMTNTSRDRHFTPMYDHCHPCQIEYDFIGKMETMGDDVKYLIDSWNSQFGTNIDFEEIDAYKTIDRISTQLVRFFRLYDDMKKCMPIFEALKREWRSFQIVGVLPIEAEFPFTEKEAISADYNKLYSVISEIYRLHRNSAKMRNQRFEAMVEAYRTVPIQDLLKLREVLRPDCELFGYDPSPSFIFKRQEEDKKPLLYFKPL